MLGVLLDSQKRGFLAKTRTIPKVAIWKTNQNLKSEDDNHLSITNSNQACFAKMAG